MDEGTIVVTLDEVLDPREAGANAKRPGTKYHFISVKRAGQGTAELYVSEDIHAKVKQLAAAGVTTLGLVFNLNKFRGQFEPRLSDVVAVS